MSAHRPTSDRFALPYEATIRDIAALAEREMRASGLPGEFGGPTDAYRHMVWVGEMTRRLGPRIAYIASEANEWRAKRGARRSLEAGRPVAPSNQPDSILMDRHNNGLGLLIGDAADTFDEVVSGARARIVQAGSDGSGHNGRPVWLPKGRWVEGPGRAPGRNWPFDADAVTDRSHIDGYRQGSAMHRDGTQDIIDAPGGPIYVRPHTRNGRPVNGHIRTPGGR